MTKFFYLILILFYATYFSKCNIRNNEQDNYVMIDSVRIWQSCNEGCGGISYYIDNTNKKFKPVKFSGILLDTNFKDYYRCSGFPYDLDRYRISLYIPNDCSCLGSSLKMLRDTCYSAFIVPRIVTMKIHGKQEIFRITNKTKLLYYIDERDVLETDSLFSKDCELEMPPPIKQNF